MDTEDKSAAANDGPIDGGGANDTSAPSSGPNAVDEIESLMRFDPFARKAEDAGALEDTSKAAPGKETGIPPKDTKGQIAEGTSTGGQPANAPAPADDPEKELLRQALKDKDTLIQSLQKPAAGEPGKGTEGGKEVKSNIPAYEVRVPDNLVEALASEDPRERSEALTGLIKGTAQLVHTKVMEMVGAQIQEVVTNFPRVIQSHFQAEQARKEIFDDFYGKYPELKKPAIVDLVKKEARNLQTKGLTEYNDKFRDTLATNVKAILADLGVSFKAETRPAKSNGAAPNFVGGNSSRSSSVKSEADDIADTLFG